MKVTHTKNGKVKLTLTRRQANALYGRTASLNDAFSNKLFAAFDEFFYPTQPPEPDEDYRLGSDY